MCILGRRCGQPTFLETNLGDRIKAANLDRRKPTSSSTDYGLLLGVSSNSLHRLVENRSVQFRPGALDTGCHGADTTAQTADPREVFW